MSVDSPSVHVLAPHHRNRELLADCLQGNGFLVELAGTVSEFDELLDEAAEISLVVIDFTGISDGVVEVCNPLSSRGIPIIVLARPLSPRVQGIARSLGAQITLQKPTRKDELLQWVTALTLPAAK